MTRAPDHPVDAAAAASPTLRTAADCRESAGYDQPADRPPERTRRLGRPRLCTASDVPARLAHWHAPRANRWERLDVIAGTLATEWLRPASIATLHLASGAHAWIAPGRRWRVVPPAADACFELATYADATTAADAPQVLRAALLDAAAEVRVGKDAGVATVLDELAAGDTRLLRAPVECFARVAASVRAGDGTLFWHPLAAGPRECAALVARAPQPVALADYMGRDHAVIEAALAGALRGDGERARWLCHTLTRHLAIEERLLFPEFLRDGGDAELVAALLREHQDLRRHLPRLRDPGARRRFLLMLDGHDEKEEQRVYPDIAARVPTAGALARLAMAYPLVGPES